MLLQSAVAFSIEITKIMRRKQVSLIAPCSSCCCVIITALWLFGHKSSTFLAFIFPFNCPQLEQTTTGTRLAWSTEE